MKAKWQSASEISAIQWLMAKAIGISMAKAIKNNQ